jgi:lipid II:glycine glycyltransferase (peptidoglycan interpeptide bridge formation enzyme)
MVKWSLFNESAASWDITLSGLTGATIHQTYASGEARIALGWRVVRMVAKRENNTIMAMAQVSVRRLKFGVALCWIPGGPAGDLTCCDSTFRQVLQSQLAERFIFLRMNALRYTALQDEEILSQTGWKRSKYRLTTGLSMDYSLVADDAQRMVNASSNWRHNLKRSAKYGLTVERWDNPNPEKIMQIYQAMETLKGLEQQHSFDEIQSLIQTMGDKLLMFRCLDQSGNLIALRAAGLLGNQAWDLLAAAAPPARKVYASHALFWALTTACKQMGATHYDLSGIDPINNKGVYDFKNGTGAEQKQYLGEWEWANLPGLCWLANVVMRRRKGAI